jgi:hypothetical protein
VKVKKQRSLMFRTGLMSSKKRRDMMQQQQQQRQGMM